MRRTAIIFVLTVVLPTLLATVYYGLVASDVYITEARFIVRSPERPSQAGLGALLQGTALSRSNDDAYAVHDFVRSRDAARELDERLKIVQAYRDESIDLFARFPGLDWDDSFESFHRHYQKHVHVAYDAASSISVLQVRAYTPDTARDIAEQLLQMGERLVNNMNLRSREDLIEVAEREVRIAEERVQDAALALAGFRSDRSVFDPSSQSAMQLQAVARLREELIAAEAQLAQVRRVSPDNPQIDSLRSRVDGLRQAITQETAKVTGGRTSLSAKSPAFDRLQLEKAFADRQLGTALAALDTARSEAQRKQLYLERLVQPNLPDSAMEPRRVRSAFTVFVVGLLAWGVVSLVVAGIREHVD